MKPCLLKGTLLKLEKMVFDGGCNASVGKSLFTFASPTVLHRMGKDASVATNLSHFEAKREQTLRCCNFRMPDLAGSNLSFYPAHFIKQCVILILARCYGGHIAQLFDR